MSLMLSLELGRKQEIFINWVMIYQNPCLFTSRGEAEKEDVMLKISKLIDSFMSGKFK